MALFYVVGLLLVLYYALRWYFTRTFNYWKKRNVAGPEPVPLFGNTKEMNLRRKNGALVFKDIYDQFPEEKVVGFFRMTTPTLLLRDLDIIKQIMIKDFDLFSDRGIEFSKQGLGQTLFHADGDNWKGLRTKFTPLFTTIKLKGMYHLVEERADRFIEYLNEQCQKSSELEIHSAVQKYTIASIAACAFGVDIDTLHSKLDVLETLDKLTLTPNIFGEIDMLYPGLLRKLNLSFFPAKVQNFFYDLVKRISAERNGKPSNRNDFMDLMLELKNVGAINYANKSGDHKSVEITDDVVAAQAFVFYIAGYETSATTMAYMLHELAVNPEVQDKLRAEIDRVTEANNGRVTYDSLKEMKYLSKVLNETLRKHAVVNPLQRVAKVNYTIPGTDVVVKKGQLVMVSVRGIHYDEKYYPNSEVFDPERFSPEAVAARHPCAFIPFGIGPRNCIGLRFGELQTSLGVAKILLKFRVEPTPTTKKHLEVVKNRLLVAPDGGVQLRIIPRK